MPLKKKEIFCRLHIAYRSNSLLVQATDGCTVHCSINSSRQSATTSKIVKCIWSQVRSHVSSIAASIELYLQQRNNILTPLASFCSEKATSPSSAFNTNNIISTGEPFTSHELFRSPEHTTKHYRHFDTFFAHFYKVLIF